MTDFLKFGNELLESYIQTASHAINYSDGEMRENFIGKIRDNLTRYCELEANLNHITDVVKRYAPTTVDTVEEMNQILPEYCNSISTFEADLSDNNYLKHYDQQVSALMKTVGGASENLNQTDDDLTVTQNTINVICPISKSRMVDPVRNVICGHVYDKGSVVSMLEMNKRTKCPIVGCSNQEFLTIGNLNPDLATKNELERLAA